MLLLFVCLYFLIIKIKKRKERKTVCGFGPSPEKEEMVVELEEGSQNDESTSAAPGQKMAGREVWSCGGYDGSR